MSDSKETSAAVKGNANVVIADDFKGNVIFNGESAGYKNAVGMYTYGSDGAITGVKILWANASLKGSGGDLEANKSAAEVALHSGDKVGFFVVPDGYSQNGMADVLNSTSGSFKFVDANGKPGNVNGGVELKLVYVASNGAETVVKSTYGTSIFHSTDDGSKGLNGDKLNHVVTTVDPEKGTIKIGFEDLKGGGDKDFDDAVITINVGAPNAKLISEGKAEKVLTDRAVEKIAAEKSAKDKAEHDAAEKAAKGKAEKEAAEKAAADRVAAEKAAADKAAADKLAAEQAAADKAAADKLAAEQAAAEKAATDKLAAEKAEADRVAADKAAADKAAADAAEAAKNHDELVLHAADVSKGITSEVLVGGKSGDAISGGIGNDEVWGKDGNDVLNGDDKGRATGALAIDVSLIDADNSETMSLTIAGVPKGATLSAGLDNGDGTWSLVADDLKNLSVTADDGAKFTLTVTATATDASGAVMTRHADVNVSFDNGNKDIVVGGRGNDVMTGGAGDDVMYGGSVPTTTSPVHIATFADNDVVHGNDGNDVVYGNSGDDQVFGDAGNDFVSGGRGNDFVSGGDGDDIMQGNSGDDRMNGEAGDDQMTGGSGFDTLDFSLSANGMMIDMSQQVAVGMGSDTINGFEMIIGSDFSDVMTGDSHDNVFEGGAGDDVIRGAKGNDTLTGGKGNDTFTWLKSDVYNTKAQQGWVDHVTDFQVGDTLDMSGFFKAGATNIANLVQITDGTDGTTVSLKFAGQFHDVVVLDGVHGLTATDMMKDGMLLVA